MLEKWELELVGHRRTFTVKEEGRLGFKVPTGYYVI